MVKRVQKTIYFKAEDIDKGVNADIEFSILNSEYSSLFTVTSPESGTGNHNNLYFTILEILIISFVTNLNYKLIFFVITYLKKILLNQC